MALAPNGNPERAGALSRFGEAAAESGRLRDASAALEEAIDVFRTTGDIFAEVRAMVTLEVVLERQIDPKRSRLVLEARELIESLPPSSELVEVLSIAAFNRGVGGEPEEALALAERALAVAAEVGLPRPARALGYRGGVRCLLGDAGGLADYADAEELALQAGQGRVAATTYNNHGIALWFFEGPPAALEAFDEGRRLAEVRGLDSAALGIRASALPVTMGAGDLEGTLAAAHTLGAQAEADGDEFSLIEIRAVQAVALTLQGRADEAAGYVNYLVDAVRRSIRPDNLAIGFGAAAVVHCALGERVAARALLTELDATPNLGQAEQLPPYLPGMVRSALAIGELEIAERLGGHLAPRNPYAEHALVGVRAAVAEARGEAEIAVGSYADAASRWEAFGVVPEHGFTLLGLGRCLLERSRPGGSTGALQQARHIFARCSMRPYLEETDALLTRATALSS